MDDNKNDPDWASKVLDYLDSLRAKAQHLKVLSLRGFGMNCGIWHYDLSSRFDAFCNIEEIDLSDNFIDSVIIDFSKFKSLKKINFSKNALYYWGNEGSFRIHEHFKAPNLEHLDLSFGCAGYIIIGQKAPFINSLKWLDLSGNHFTDFYPYAPNGVPVLKLPPLPNLKYLALRSNFYQSVPKIRYLKSLETVDLSNNDLRCNFEELLCLPNLKNIMLNSIGISKIPKALYALNNPEAIYLQGNSIPENEQKKLIAHFPETKIIF